MPITVQVNLRPLRQQTAGFARSEHGKRMFKQWGVMYRSFTQRRYSKLSRGAGGWPALKPATIRRRRKRSKVILRDLGLLFAAVNPTMPGPGSVERISSTTLTLGFEGGGTHSKGSLTISEIAEVHNDGRGNNPQRQIIVEPDQPTLKLLVRAYTENQNRMFQ